MKINPRNRTSPHYIVQYNETNFEFLRKLASRFGEWLFYDGTELSYYNPDREGTRDCMNADGEIQLLCGDKVSIKNEFEYQKRALGEEVRLFGSKSGEDYLEDPSTRQHLPDFDDMPEINLVERLKISKKGALCDCSYSQSTERDDSGRDCKRFLQSDGSVCLRSVCNRDRDTWRAPWIRNSRDPCWYGRQ